MSEPTRLEQIELKLSFLERSLNELSDTVLRQQREIDALRTRERELKEQMALLEASSSDDAEPFERPPHY
ncbi:MAG TPA: SlyX family protein [Steroidobacteraceae bacterium]